MHGTLFFQLANATSGSDDDSGRDLVLIIPMAGEMVIDNLAFFSAEGEQRALARWHGEQAEEFARWCVGD